MGSSLGDKLLFPKMVSKLVDGKFVRLYFCFVCLLIVGSACSPAYNRIEKDMVIIPSGTFVMGSVADGADLDESPEHEVFVPSFKLLKTEVTQKLWRSVMHFNPSLHIGDDYPVEAVSYYDALLFIQKLNKLTGKKYRLPTESEWEYVASQGAEIHEINLDDVAWYLSNADGMSHRCATKTPNPLGVYDLIGNVNEWCFGLYDGCDYDGHSVIQIDTLVEEAVFRGGSFNSEKKYCRVANRNHFSVNFQNYAVGFRVAESIDE